MVSNYHPIDTPVFELNARSKSLMTTPIDSTSSPAQSVLELYLTQPSRNHFTHNKNLTLPEIKAIQELELLQDYDKNYMVANRLFNENELICMPSPDLKPLDGI